jgi:putative transposase
MVEGTRRRAFKFRFYPTPAQAQELLRTFGCVRKVYNLALEARIKSWSENRRRLTYSDTSALLTQWKRTPELAFLADVSSVPLQQTLRHLEAAFVAYWKRGFGYPRFKSKRQTKCSAEYTKSGFRWRSGEIVLAKMDKPLEIRWSRPLPSDALPSGITITRDSAHRWFVTLRFEDSSIRPLPANGEAVGIDLGLIWLATLSTGEKLANIQPARKDSLRLRRAQRRLARKRPGSANREKARLRVAKIYARIGDRRADYLQKITTRLVRENQTVVIEDLSPRNLMRNRRLARAIGDAAWGAFRSMLRTKCEWYGRQLIVINRWYPSTELCSSCGAISESLPIAERTWTCANCQVSHDRDVNAARNILAAGLAVSACGADVRPQRRTSSERAVGGEAGSLLGNRRSHLPDSDGDVNL